MKPRIHKKLSKRVYEIAGDRFGKPFHDEEPIGSLAYEFKGFPKSEVTAKVFRNHCNAVADIRRCLLVGGGPDCFGECDDPETLYQAAKRAVLFEFGEIPEHPGPDDDRFIGWPEWPRRLTGKEVIRLLKIMAEPHQGRGGGDV